MFPKKSNPINEWTETTENRSSLKKSLDHFCSNPIVGLIKAFIIFLAHCHVVVTRYTEYIDTMPATNYGWSLQESTSMLQAWGTKRKCFDTEEPDSKRQCTHFICDNTYNEMRLAAESSVHCDGDRNRSSDVSMEVHMEGTMTENRVPDLHPLYPSQIVSHNPEGATNLHNSNNSLLHGASTTVLEENNNNNNTSSSTPNCCQNSMIMDLQDECYTTAILPENVTTDAEYEAACNMVAAMESEGAPDPYQYRTSHSSLMVSESLDHSSITPSTPARSLHDHTLDMTPYISDYY